MQNHEDVLRPFAVDRRFILAFLLYLAVFLFLAQGPAGIFDWFKPFTAYLSYRFWRLFPIPVTQSGPLITFYSFPMEITHECTALSYLAIFSAGVLSCRFHTLRYRLAGFLTGVGLIISLNVVRIGVLGMVGHYARDMFELVHVYLWQGAFAVIVFATWLLWINKGILITKKAAQGAMLALLTGAITFGIVELGTASYAAVIATLANAALTSAKVKVLSEGSIILFRTAFGTLHVDLLYEVLNTIVLSMLFAVSVLSVRRTTLAKRVSLGAFLIVVQHYLFIVLYGLVFARGVDLAFLMKVLWMARGLSIVVPVLIWLIAARIFSDRTTGDRQA